MPYLLAKSTSAGLTWSLKEAPADMLSARPRAVALSGGALIVAGGRPALNLWVSVDGGAFSLSATFCVGVDIPSVR